MSAPTDTPASSSTLDNPLRAAAEELALSYRLPPARYVTAGENGTVVLEAAGDRPLEDILAWAGEMAAAPHWWTLRTTGPVPGFVLYASGLINGLAVTISAPTGYPLPPHPTTDDVLTAAAHARWGRP